MTWDSRLFTVRLRIGFARHTDNQVYREQNNAVELLGVSLYRGSCSDYGAKRSLKRLYGRNFYMQTLPGQNRASIDGGCDCRGE